MAQYVIYLHVVVVDLCDIAQSDRDYYVYYSTDPVSEKGPAAVRWTHYKAHFHSKGYAYYTLYIYCATSSMAVLIFWSQSQ